MTFCHPAFGKSGPNASLPRGTLTQLLMGYRVWEGVRSGFPDAIASPHLGPLLEVLLKHENFEFIFMTRKMVCSFPW